MVLISKSNPLSRNIFHLIGCVSTLAMFLFWIITGLAAEYGFDITNHNAKFIVWLVFLILLITANVAIGILQVVYDKDKSRNYVGYFTIFVSPLFFPIFTSLVMYLRSGLSVKRQESEIRKFVIDNIVLFEKALEEQGLKISKKTHEQIKEVTLLQQKQMLDTHNGNAFKVSIIEKEVPFDQWPQIWDNKELIAIANDVPLNNKTNKKNS